MWFLTSGCVDVVDDVHNVEPMLRVIVTFFSNFFDMPSAYNVQPVSIDLYGVLYVAMHCDSVQHFGMQAYQEHPITAYVHVTTRCTFARRNCDVRAVCHVASTWNSSVSLQISAKS